VHFISGVDGRERGLSLGAVGYLLKPASRDQLLAAVSSLMPAAGGATSVLIVEDNATEGASLRELLSRQGFDTVCVQNATDALAELERHRYPCMILDLGLPDMDGLAVLETLRSRDDIEAPRVIVHTGRALNKRETQQLESYASAVVLKDGDSALRLIEEIRLFVRHVSDGISSQHRSQASPVSSDVSLEGTKILLAEDDMRTVYALSALLRGKGAEVFVADTGREALELLSAHPDVQCVLMDIMMPEMDGYEAMRRLRQDARFASLPVVALTARAMKGEKERCIEAGATEYLTKPVDSARLLQTVRACVSGGVA
ncbi:MAG TPA: response regulator, partial [Polyangiaceae bacterium]|nr:response regulator [Polyangiaceae bacterium]